MSPSREKEIASIWPAGSNPGGLRTSTVCRNAGRLAERRYTLKETCTPLGEEGHYGPLDAVPRGSTVLMRRAAGFGQKPYGGQR